MSFGDNVAIGYCPSITPESGNPPCYLSMQASLNTQPEPQTYAIENILYIAESALGCGSNIWHISGGGKHFIAKDTWHDPRRAYTEGEILQLLGDNIDGIPIFEEGCMVGNVKTASTSGHHAAAVGFEQAVVLLCNGSVFFFLSNL